VTIPKKKDLNEYKISNQNTHTRFYYIWNKKEVCKRL